jgi:hypothetical protein
MSPLLALFGHGAMSDLSPECAPKRTSADHCEFMGSRPNPVVFISETRTDFRMPEFKDKLCVLIGKSVQSVVEKFRDGLAIYFDDGDSITISLRFEDATSVEAAMLNEQNGTIFDVWRYE